MSGRIVATTDGPVGRLVFDNRERRNAMTLEMWQALPGLLDAFAADPAVRVVVLAGAGGEAFVSGADISEFEAQRADATAGAHYNAVSTGAMAALGAFEKPVIAAIRGFCMGGGLAIAMKADIRVAAESAVFAIPAARLGVAYPFESVRDLVSLVGPSQAKSILFTGRRLDADEAFALGLVTEVTPELESRVNRLADTLCDNAPLSLKAAKAAVDQIARDSIDPAAIEALSRACFDSADYAEGRRAFMEKRPPAFTGA